MIKTKRAMAGSRQKPVVLDMDQCPECATRMLPSRKAMTLPINGEEVSVSGISHLECPKCGEGMLRRDEARAFRERAFDKYRTKHKLLSPDEIRQTREQLGMSQKELAKKLQLGEVTISRWESNSVIQTAALDLLLRLMRDVPEVRKYIQNGRQAA